MHNIKIILILKELNLNYELKFHRILNLLFLPNQNYDLTDILLHETDNFEGNFFKSQKKPKFQPEKKKVEISLSLINDETPKRSIF